LKTKAENTNRPLIRFNGYTSAWGQRKLSEISDKVIEKNASRLYSETLTNSAEYGIVSQREFFDKDISNEENIDGYYIVRNNDFIYNPRISSFAPVGPIKRNTLGRNGVMSPLYYVFRTHDIEPTYLEHFFSGTGWHRFMKLNGDSGARSDRFSIKDSVFRELPLPYPSLDEQQKIGEFFDTIGNLVTLHRRECDKTVNIKKAMLEKMFPKDGADKPEIRFAGFAGAWEQRKLSELAEFSKGQGYSKGDLRENGTPIILYGRLYTQHETVISEVDTFAIKKEKSVFSKGKEVIVPASGETAEDIARASVVENAGILLGGDLNILKPQPEIDPAFLAITISNGTQQKELSRRAQGKSVVHIHNADLQEVLLVYPTLDEQRKISAVFRDLDRLVTLHRRELVNLQNMKNALLEKMFVPEDISEDISKDTEKRVFNKD
jgi:type I restriction enzyme S subunit